MPNSETVAVISKMDDVDPMFREVCELIYGNAVDPREAYDISKMNDGSEMHIPGGLKIKKPKKSKMSDRTQRMVTAGLSATGAAAGTAGLAYAANDVRNAVKKVPRERIKTSTKVLIPLEVAGLAGEVMATKILHGDTKKKQHALSKGLSDALAEIVTARREGKITTDTAITMAAELTESIEKKALPWRTHAANSKHWEKRARAAEHIVAMRPVGRRAVIRATAAAGLAAGGAVGYHAGKKKGLKMQPLDTTVTKQPAVNLPVYGQAGAVNTAVKEADKLASGVSKNEQVDYAFTGEISKMDTDKRLAFGWCSLSEINGEPVVDLQGDYAPIDEIEKSAYAYVKDSRVGGDMHTRDGETPKHTSDLVESFIATPEKLRQMGLSEEVAKSVPTGWWVGFKVNDDEQWAMVKDGRRAGFSIHGKGSRVQKALDS
jgi:hypothetical protein